MSAEIMNFLDCARPFIAVETGADGSTELRLVEADGDCIVHDATDPDDIATAIAEWRYAGCRVIDLRVKEVVDHG